MFSQFPSSLCSVAAEHFFPLRPYPKTPLQHTLHPFSIQTIFSNMLLFGFVFPIYITILFILSVCKDYISNFYFVSLKCYNLQFIFPGFCFLNLPGQRKCSCKILDVSVSQLYLPCIISFNCLCSFSAHRQCSASVPLSAFTTIQGSDMLL